MNSPNKDIKPKLEPRLDGISNTLTTVLKDNYVMIIDEVIE